MLENEERLPLHQASPAPPDDSLSAEDDVRRLSRRIHPSHQGAKSYNPPNASRAKRPPHFVTQPVSECE